MRLALAQARALVAQVLQRAGANPAMAESTACALVLAESQGLGSHGLSRANQYATHLRNGRVDGAAVPQVLRRKGGAIVVDAGEGLAFPACDLAVREAIAAAGEHGVATRNKEVYDLLKYQKSLTFFTTALKSNELMVERLQRSRFV